MRRGAVVGAFALVGVGFVCGAGSLRARQEVRRRLAVDPAVSIRIHNLIGSTKIVPWDRDSIVVSGTVLPGGGRFDMGGGGSGAKIYVELPPNVAQPAPSHLELRVPRGARVWVKSASAVIEVDGSVRALDLNSVGGAIVVRGIADELRAESMDGTVTVEAAAWTRIKSASGAVVVSGGEDVAVETITGTVRYRGVSFGRVRIETVDGDIWFDGEVPRGAHLELESHSGRVELTLPPFVSAEFALMNFRGRIENPFDPDPARPLPDLRGRASEFVTGLGEATVTVRNFRGDIVLRRR